MHGPREWTQHILIKSLCSSSKVKVNTSIITKIRSEFFTTPLYKKSFRLIREHFDETGTFYTWSEFLKSPDLGISQERSLRAIEKRRKLLKQEDDSLELPETEEQYTSFLNRVIFDSKHLKLIELQNNLSDILNKEITPEKLQEGLSLLSDTTKDIDNLRLNSGELFKINYSDSIAVMKNFYKQLKSDFFIPTGFHAFDSINLGIPLDSLFVIAAKSGCGKSSMALQYLINAKEQGARCCLLPLEMSKEQMISRLVSNKLQIPIHELNKNLNKYWKKFKLVIKDFCSPKFQNDDSCLHFYEPDVLETLEEALIKLIPYKYNIICVDYINLMAQSAKDKWESLVNDANYAKRYATKYKTQIVLLAQLDDKTEDIRYSRGLKEAASNMWYWTESAQDIKEAHRVVINQPKSRNQDPTPFPLMADLSCSRFTNWIDEVIEKPKTTALSKGFDSAGSDVPD